MIHLTHPTFMAAAAGLLVLGVLAGSARAAAPLSGAEKDPTTDGVSIRPFQFHASDAALTDLRQRVAATRWPSGELVTDATQGVQLATMRELARYWQTD